MLFRSQWKPEFYAEPKKAKLKVKKPSFTTDDDINTPYPGHTITVHYTLDKFADEDISLIKWYRDKNGKSELVKQSTGYGDKTYLIQADDAGSTIRCLIIPQIRSGDKISPIEAKLDKKINEGYSIPANAIADRPRVNGAVNVFLASDSTCKDYSALGMWNGGHVRNEGSWGEFLQSYFNGAVAVQNYANGGRSSRNFINEGTLDKIETKISKGDYLFIQFGHNDAKESDSTRFCPPDKYAENLLFMIRQAKAVGALPVLCTPIARRHYKNNELQYVHGDYPVAMKGVAERENVPLVDMTTLTMEWLAPLGDEGSQPYFVYIMKPGEYSKYPEGKTDNTHLRLSGALKVAQLFAQAVKEEQISPLNKYVEPNNTEIRYSVGCGIK